MAPLSPVEALTVVDCPHLDRHKVLCLRCAAEAVRPAAEALAARIRVAERARDEFRTRLEEVLEEARPVVAGPQEDPVVYQVRRGPVERARAALEATPPAYGDVPVTSFVIVHADEDWERAARDAERRAAQAVHEAAQAVLRAVGAAQRAAEAAQRARDAEALNSRVERAVRELLAEWLEQQMLVCPYGHDGDPLDCGYCWAVKMIRVAVEAAQGKVGPTSAAVRRRTATLDKRA